jgi:hypothetical protein
MNGEKNSTRVLLFFFMFLLLIICCCGGDAAVFRRGAASVFHGGAALFHMYSISGTVSGALPSGVTITLTDGKATLAKTTDANGKFSFTNLANRKYEVTPSLTGYIFSPACATITIFGANVVGSANFTATKATYSISGAVSGDVLPGVKITLSGTGSTTTTDWNGNYSFSGLVNGIYKVTPSLAGYKFIPASSMVIVGGANAAAYFTATKTTYSISGAVSGDVLSGVKITLSGTGSTTTTDKSGNYSFPDLVNGIYKVTPSPPTDYKFIPASSMVIVGGANAAANFTARFMAVTVHIKKSSIKLLEMQTKQLTAIISLSAALNKNVIWKSSNTSVASVSSTGLVTAVAVGNAEVTVTTSDGNMTSTYSVEVVSPDRLIVIIKADDLTASSIGSSFMRLFKVCSLAEIPISAGLIIETLKTATASQLAFLSNLDPQEECEFFIHGYNHYMKNDKTEFNGPDEKEQIATFKKILDTCQLYLKRDLSVLGTPGNVADSNTRAALDKFPQIKTVFFIQSLAGHNRFVLPNLNIEAEYEVGKMYGRGYIIQKASQLPAGSATVLQIHVNYWTEKEWSEFDLLIKALKEKGAFFITPSEYAKWIERLHPPDLRAHERGTIEN